MKRLLLILVVLALVLLGLVLVYGQGGQGANQRTSPLPEVTPTPTLLEKEIRSGDGSMVLKMVGEKFPDGRVNYSFWVLDRKENSEKKVYSQTTLPGESMDLPHNAWSPNNKQFFIEQYGWPTKKYYVFKADGTEYKEGEHHLDVMSYWLASKNGYEIETITGWGGLDLLVLKTRNEEGDRGPSFWFVTSSRGFLRLRS